MTEEERIGEQIARKLCEVFRLDWRSSKEAMCSFVEQQILSLKGIEIRAGNQSLPSFRNAVNKSYNDYMLGQEDMLTPDSEGNVWVKVIPKKKSGNA